MSGRWLVAGAAGFIGANLVRRALTTRDADRLARVVSLDALTYAGSEDNLAPIAGDARHAFVRGDIGDRDAIGALLAELRPTAVINLAAETHVDRSIDDPSPFVRTNVDASFALLESLRRYWRDLPDDRREAFRYVHVSTDEVYGSVEEGASHERSPTEPRSPYAASKAAADHLVGSYAVTYGLPAMITRCCNNYGPYQLPEKLLPLMLCNALAGERLPVYGDGQNVREWMYVDDHADAVLAVLDRGRPGEVYNVGGGEPQTTLEIVGALCRVLDARRPRAEGSYADLVELVADRPGHDRRYAIDGGKLHRELGWRAAVGLDEGLARTVDWYLAHGDWCDARRRHTRRIGLGR